jgi:hypothetical protein
MMKRHNSMTKAFEACYGTKPTIQDRSAEEVARFAEQFFSTTPPETHEMVDSCKEDEHDKVFSGEYFATNPPRWSWICKTCGELGREEAHVVTPKNVRDYARVLVKFHPMDATWWRRFLKDDEV